MNTRNKPCACGSGRKSKKCCESPEKKAQRYAEWKAEQHRLVMERLERLEKEREEYRAKNPEGGPFIYRPAGHSKAMMALAAMAALSVPSKYR